MIYFDSAATTFQKPRTVADAMRNAMATMSSPGRGGYPAAMRAAEAAFDCRTELAELYHLENPDDATFSAMIQEAKDRSRLDYDVDVKTSDRILSLSTCAYKYTDSVEKRDLRFVVQARLLRPGEEIPTSAKVTRNTDVKEPAQHATSTIAG